MIRTASKDGMTLLHAAAIVGNPDITKLLLDYGIDPHKNMSVSMIGEKSILSALQIARMLKNDAVADLIEQVIAAATPARARIDDADL
jgi:ankyrin repeat protein